MKSFVAFIFALNLFCTYAASVEKSSNVNQNLWGPEQHLTGGKLGDIKVQPYTISLALIKNENVVRRCAGARLDKNWYITVAECLDKSKYDSIRLTSSNAPFSNFIHTNYTLDKRSTFFIHPNYNPATKLNNIALIKNAEEFYKPPSIIDMPGKRDRYEPFFKRSVTISAWVNTTQKSDKTEQLNVAAVYASVINIAECKKLYLNKSIEDYHICVYNIDGKTLSEDDIGAPMVVYIEGRQTLLGIASSIKPLTKSQPMVFIKASSYIEWVSYVTFRRVLP